jgi:transcriptional regulator with XRE-family HTH domain
MESTHIHCQHSYASAPLLTMRTAGILPHMDYDLWLKRLGAEIRRRRKELELNQIEFAEKVQTDQGSISRLENGKQGFDSPLIHRIAEVFKVDPGEMFAAATNTKLPEGIHPDAHRIAVSWSRLEPKTREAVNTIVMLDLIAVRDPKVAKHIAPAPESPSGQPTGSKPHKPSKIKR